MGYDVFKTDFKNGGVWQFTGAVMSFAGVDLENSLVLQSAQMSFVRSVSQIYPINQNKSIWIVSPGTGTLAIQGTIGPGDSIKTFIEAFDNPCALGTDANVVSIRAAGSVSCLNGEDTQEFSAANVFTLTGCILQGLSLGVQGGQSVIPVSSGYNLLFTGLAIG